MIIYYTDAFFVFAFFAVAKLCSFFSQRLVKAKIKVFQSHSAHYHANCYLFFLCQVFKNKIITIMVSNQFWALLSLKHFSELYS